MGIQLSKIPWLSNLFVIAVSGSVKCLARRLGACYGNARWFRALIFPRKVNDLIMLAQDFEYNILITCFAPQQGVPGHQENVHGLLQEFDRNIRTTTLEADCLSICNSFAVIQSNISVI
jgi:hypothetical protein